MKLYTGLEYSPLSMQSMFLISYLLIGIGQLHASRRKSLIVRVELESRALHWQPKAKGYQICTSSSRLYLLPLLYVTNKRITVQYRASTDLFTLKPISIGGAISDGILWYLPSVRWYDRCTMKMNDEALD